MYSVGWGMEEEPIHSPLRIHDLGSSLKRRARQCWEGLDPGSYVRPHIAQNLRLVGHEAAEAGPEGAPLTGQNTSLSRLWVCPHVANWGRPTHLPPPLCPVQTNAATTVPVSQMPGPSQPAVLQPSVEPTQPTPQVLLTRSLWPLLSTKGHTQTGG